MKAVRYYGKEDLRVEDIARPEPEKGELLVKVQACAICGTDLKAYFSGNPRIKPPQTVGHEFVGEIVELGAGTEGFAVGERVTMATSISCGTGRSSVGWAARTWISSSGLPFTRMARR